MNFHVIQGFWRFNRVSADKERDCMTRGKYEISKTVVD